MLKSPQVIMPEIIKDWLNCWTTWHWMNNKGCLATMYLLRLVWGILKKCHCHTKFDSLPFAITPNLHLCKASRKVPLWLVLAEPIPCTPKNHAKPADKAFLCIFAFHACVWWFLTAGTMWCKRSRKRFGMKDTKCIASAWIRRGEHHRSGLVFKTAWDLYGE